MSVIGTHDRGEGGEEGLERSEVGRGRRGLIGHGDESRYLPSSRTSTFQTILSLKPYFKRPI